MLFKFSPKKYFFKATAKSLKKRKNKEKNKKFVSIYSITTANSVEVVPL
jgi:hypothetical protein